MASFVIENLRGGMNNTDPEIGIAEDQCTLAQNVEFYDSLCGERRKGTSAITLPASILATDRVPFLFRHLPTTDETASELWALGVTGVASAVLSHKTTVWADVAIADTPYLDLPFQYQWRARSLHGKLFLAYRSHVDRLHVYDGTTVRATGITAPAAAPTAADSGGGGALASTRFYRQRFTQVVGGTVVRRSEPSAVLTFNPSGANASITITKAANVSEGETHWELEASLDNANFYILASTVVGTATVVDTATANNGYTSYILSETIEDYALIPSPRFLAVDYDRLLWGGSYEQTALDSRVGYTPVYAASGVGNDERFQTSQDPFKDLDRGEGGGLTGLSDTVLGANWAFKQHAIYKLTRTGSRSSSYDVLKYSNVLGAVYGSVIPGLDPKGQPCLYAMDMEQGPYRIGYGGITRCGDDLRKTWELLNIDATAVVTSCLFYPKKKQVCWNLALNSDSAPTVRIVLHTDKSRDFADGARKGWAIWTGTIASALTMCLYANNIETNAARSRRLVPFIGLDGHGLVHQCDTGTTDNGTAYVATITTRPHSIKNLLMQFQVLSGVVLGKAISGAQIAMNCIRNFGLESTSTVNVDLSPTGSETSVVRKLDNLSMSELDMVQFQITDVAVPTARWEINHIAIREEPGQSV